MLGFQRLDVYRCAVRFLGLAAALAHRCTRGQAELVDQLRRAALSIPLNIAEGSGKIGRDPARYYTIARGSALDAFCTPLPLESAFWRGFSSYCALDAIA